MKELSTTYCTFVLVILQLSVTEVISLKRNCVLMEWSVDIITKFLAFPLNWSWFYCYIWLRARSEHEKGLYLPSTPTTYTEHVIWKFQSLKLCWKCTLETSESAVFIASASQRHLHLHYLEPPSPKEQPPPLSLQKFPKSITDQEAQAMCLAHRLSTFHSTTLMSKRFWKASLQANAWQICKPKDDAYGKY